MLGRKCIVAICAAVVFAVLGQAVKAELIIDLRWEYGEKYLALSASGLFKPFPLYVYAQVYGQSSEPGKVETLRSVQGAFVSPGNFGTLVPDGDLDPVNFSTIAALDPFNGAGATAGKSQDIDGDGDLDLGGKPGAPQADWVVFRTDKMNYGASAGQGTPIVNNGRTEGVEFLIGRLIYTPTKLGWPIIDFVFKTEADGTIADDAAMWTEDGTQQLFTGTHGKLRAYGTTGIPEPSSLCLLSLAGLWLLRRTRATPDARK